MRKEKNIFIPKFTIFHVTVKSYKYTENFFGNLDSFIIQKYCKGLKNFVKLMHVSQSRFFVIRSNLQFEDFLIKIEIFKCKKFNSNLQGAYAYRFYEIHDVV